MKGSFDFLGLNYYSGKYAQSTDGDFSGNEGGYSHCGYLPAGKLYSKFYYYRLIVARCHAFFCGVC